MQGRSVRQVAADLDLNETSLRLTTAERDEPKELRMRVKRLEMERELLK